MKKIMSNMVGARDADGRTVISTSVKLTVQNKLLQIQASQTLMTNELFVFPKLAINDQYHD